MYERPNFSWFRNIFLSVIWIRLLFDSLLVFRFPKCYRSPSNSHNKLFPSPTINTTNILCHHHNSHVTSQFTNIIPITMSPINFFVSHSHYTLSVPLFQLCYPHYPMSFSLSKFNHNSHCSMSASPPSTDPSSVGDPMHRRNFLLISRSIFALPLVLLPVFVFWLKAGLIITTAGHSSSSYTTNNTPWRREKNRTTLRHAGYWT